MAKTDTERNDEQRQGEETGFFRHFRSTYGRWGHPFESYRSAYHYAESWSDDPRVQGKSWDEVEDELHQDWEQSHPGTWTRYREAIRYGWDKTRGG
jgi:hypothetical protein